MTMIEWAGKNNFQIKSKRKKVAMERVKKGVQNR